MMQCIVYLRVSTRGQAKGHGLIRQLEACIDKAKRDSLVIRSVYVDICSGTGPQPQRDLAIAEAKKHGVKVLVEARDRWTRKSGEPDEVSALAETASLEIESLESALAGILLQGLAEMNAAQTRSGDDRRQDES